MEQAPQTLRLVLETTEELTAEIGCQNTTLQEIIRRSGISKGAIYHYVQSKDELFGLILEGHMSMKVRKMGSHSMGASPHNHAPAAALSLSSSNLGPVSGIIKGLLQPADQHQLVLRRCFIYLLSRQDQPDVARILDNLHRSWIQFIEQWIVMCQDAGLLQARIQPRQTSAFIVSVLFGLMVQKSISENKADSDPFTLDTQLVLANIAGVLGVKA